MVTFTHPFNLSGVDEVQPAGTYTVETDEELLESSVKDGNIGLPSTPLI